MLSTNPVTANLIKAREMIAGDRWSCRPDKGDGLCALQALSQQTGCRSWQRVSGPELEALSAAAEEQLSTPQATTIRFKPRSEIERVYTVNDHLGHAAVMRMFDRAIELSLVPA